MSAKVELRRNKNTGEVEAFKNGAKVGSVSTMGDEATVDDAKQKESSKEKLSKQ